MRLLQKMLALPPHVSTYEGAITDVEGLIDKITRESMLAYQCKGFILDDVAEFYAAHERTHWTFPDHFHHVLPPIAKRQPVWLEWKEPEVYRTANGELPSPPHTYSGLLCFHLPTGPDCNLLEAAGAIDAYIGFDGFLPAAMSSKSDFAGMVRGSQWLLLASSWFSASVAPFDGLAVWLGIVYVASIDADGRILKVFLTGPAAKGLASRMTDVLQPWSALHIAAYGLQFLQDDRAVRVPMKGNKDRDGGPRPGLVPPASFTAVRRPPGACTWCGLETIGLNAGVCPGCVEARGKEVSGGR